jgi:hypothetical protein
MRLPRPDLKIKILLPVSLIGLCRGLERLKEEKEDENYLFHPDKLFLQEDRVKELPQSNCRKVTLDRI